MGEPNQHQSYGTMKYSNSFNAYSNSGAAANTRYTGSKYGSDYKAATGITPDLELFDQEVEEHRFFEGVFSGDDEGGESCLFSTRSNIFHWSLNVPVKGIFETNGNCTPLACSPLPWDYEEHQFRPSSATTTVSCYDSSCSDTEQFAWNVCMENESGESRTKLESIEEVFTRATHTFSRRLLVVVFNALVQKALLLNKRQQMEASRYCAAPLPAYFICDLICGAKHKWNAFPASQSVTHPIVITNTHPTTSGSSASGGGRQLSCEAQKELASKASSQKTSSTSQSCSTIATEEENRILAQTSWF
uniref:Uncharacterized protein n=1 Tax=Ditylenchus dipsaci TaxID=166011 RepID=A0A915CU19_9BILA